MAHSACSGLLKPPSRLQSCAGCGDDQPVRAAPVCSMQAQIFMRQGVAAANCPWSHSTALPRTSPCMTIYRRCVSAAEANATSDRLKDIEMPVSLASGDIARTYTLKGSLGSEVKVILKLTLDLKTSLDECNSPSHCREYNTLVAGPT